MIFPKTSLLISVLLFVFIFLFLVSVSLVWGFWIDDCGILFNSQVQNFKDFLGLFYGTDFYALCQPSNYVHQKLSFLSVFYRPLSRVLFALQIPLFGNQPYGYFVVSMFFHALNTTLLFNIFLCLSSGRMFCLDHGSESVATPAIAFPILWALLGALIFAFHPTLVGWLGWIAAQPYHVGLFLLLLSLILFFKYVQGRSTWFLCGSCVCYVLALFLFEITIAYPIFLLFLFFMLRDLFPEIDLSWWNYGKQIAWFWLITASFLVIRVVQYPLYGAVAHKPIFSFSKIVFNRWPQVMSFVVDITNMSVLPASFRVLKIGIVCCMAWLVGFLFLKNRHKRFLCWLVVSMFLFMWPAFFTVYVVRYFYFSLPLFITFVIALIVFAQYASKRWFGTFFASLLLLISFFNMINLRRDVHQRGLEWDFYTRSCCTLVNNPIINKSKALLFVGLPIHQFQTGLAQCMWLLGLDRNIAVYYDPFTFCNLMWETEMNPLEIKFGMNALPGPRIGVRGDVAVIHMRSLDKDNLCWGSKIDNEKISLGRLVVEQGDKIKQQAYRLTYYLDKRYCQDGTIFITWDYAAQTFKIL